MYSSSSQQRRKGPSRRPSGGRRPGPATTPTSLGRQKQLSSAAALKKARKLSTDGATRNSPGANPFQRASSRLQQRTNQIPGLTAMTSYSVGATSSSMAPPGGQTSAANPFFATLAKKDKPSATTPFGMNFKNPPLVPTSAPPRPPSYAAAVKGPGSVPSFITHGPGSIPLTKQHEEGQQNRGTGGLGHTHQSTGPAHQQSLGDEPPKTLHIKNVPEHVNNPPTLRKHFARFGEITTLDCQPGRRYATVGFSTREAAVRAKKSGRLLCEEPVQIFWHSRPPQRPRADPQVPSSASESHSRDPRLAQTQTRFETSQQVGNEQGRGGGSEESLKIFLPALQAGRKRPADVAGLQSADEREGGGEGGVAGVRSVWERLEGREGEGEGGEGGEGEESTGPKLSKGKLKMRRSKDDEDGEWIPAEVGEEDEGEEEEGVAEGGDSVLRERGGMSGETGEEMDTIARSASHSYYLRSLHKPETISGIRGPEAVLQVPHQLKDGPAVGEEEGKARVYGPFPTLHLPPPPEPGGQSAADFYQSLDARDEEIRKNLVRQTSLTTARVIVGTCPDMCPEKERYMREDRRRLSWFELNTLTSEPGAPKVDHERAVKEYNRSAADKAEDLPHELRPEPVLIMTMDYLVTRVMDDGERKTEIWYDFVWNRTRAIRKDITLQQLCSKGCVELTEKCARFHILCAYFLCEEEITVFDQKMNHENLTKCLITLKQFYRDLRIEKEVHCENEAEFCCYDILLHLQDGNVLNIVEQYSQMVRQSNSVRFAVDIAFAFSSNNYAKFFKLVRSPKCSYLCGCILHRYFSEVRTTAVHVMTKAYTHSKPTSFPLAKFTELLGFENEAVATEFCVHFDLSLTKKAVKLAREFAHHPPSSLPLYLTQSLVGAKRVNRRLGEIVSGGPLPSPPKLPRPYDSFAPGTPLAPPTLPRPSPPTYTDRELMVAIDLVIAEITNEILPSVAMETLRNEQDKATKIAAASTFCESVTSDCVREECADVAMATLKNAQLEWWVGEEAQIVEEVGKVVSMEIEMGIVMELVSQVVMQIFREFHEELVSVAMSVCDDITWEYVRRESGKVCGEVVSEAKVWRQQKLEELEKQVLAKRRRRYWRKWCHQFKAHRHARECVSAIPSLPPLLPLSAQLVGSQRLPGETVISRGPLEIGEEGVADFLVAECCDLEERRRRFYSALDLPSLLSHSLLVTRPPSLPPFSLSHHTSPHLYWSLALLYFVHLPHSHLGDLELLEFLEHKLKFCTPGSRDKKNQPVPGVKKISLSETPLQDCGGPTQLKIAVKSVQIGCRGDGRRGNSRQVFRGVCAVVFLAPTPRRLQTPGGYRDDVIRSLMEKGWWEEGQVPMLVLAPFHVEEQFLAHWNMLRIALQGLPRRPAAFISDVTFDTLQLDSHTSQLDGKVCKGLKWLADHAPPQPPLSCISVRDFIEEGVQKYFIPLVKRDSQIRRENGLPSQSPCHLISLYNSVISHLSSSASSDALSTISWPLPEFAPCNFSSSLAPQLFNSEGLPKLEWNGDLHRNELGECISQYQLVQFDVAPPTNNDLPINWADHYRHCLLYLEEYVAPRHTLLLPRIKALLRGYMSHVTFDQSEARFPWDHVIITCIDHMVSVAPSDLWVTCHHGDNKEFATPTSWLVAEARTSLERVNSANSDPHTPWPKRHRRNLSDSYLFDPHHLLPTHTPHLPPASWSPLATKLTEKIGTEKQLSNDFEDELKRLLSEGERPRVAPLFPLPRPSRADHAPSSPEWAGPLEAGLQLLKMKIHTSRFQEKMDRQRLERLVMQTQDYP